MFGRGFPSPNMTGPFAAFRTGFQFHTIKQIWRPAGVPFGSHFDIDSSTPMALN